jgi:hypothetical protein
MNDLLDGIKISNLLSGSGSSDVLLHCSDPLT